LEEVVAVYLRQSLVTQLGIPRRAGTCLWWGWQIECQAAVRVDIAVKLLVSVIRLDRSSSVICISVDF